MYYRRMKSLPYDQDFDSPRSGSASPILVSDDEKSSDEEKDGAYSLGGKRLTVVVS